MSEIMKKYPRKHDTGRLSEGIIREALGKFDSIPEELNVVYFDTVGSTSTEAKLRKDEGRPTLFVAEEQTGGRGRSGKSFTCPRGDGIYMSLLFYPRSSAAEATGITAYTAVAAARAIDRLTGVKTGIKWVNDLYLGGKKIAGILTEGRAAVDGSLEYAIIGIGINLHPTDLGELNSIATSIEAEGGAPTCRAELIAEIIRELYAGLDDPTADSVKNEYLSRSVIEGKRVTVTVGDTVRRATAIRLDRELRLLVSYDDGGEDWLSSGDVSLRLNN